MTLHCGEHRVDGSNWTGDHRGVSVDEHRWVGRSEVHGGHAAGPCAQRELPEGCLVGREPDREKPIGAHDAGALEQTSAQITEATQVRGRPAGPEDAVTCPQQRFVAGSEPLVVELGSTPGQSGGVAAETKADRALRADQVLGRLQQVACSAADLVERGRADTREFVEPGDATVIDAGRVEGSAVDVHVRMDLVGEVAAQVPELPLAHLAGAARLGEHRVPNVDQTARVDGYTASTYGDRFADVYDDWYSDITDAEATADLVAGLVEQVTEPSARSVLELGVGTGRLALPLQARDLHVIGVDASDSMLDQLRAKPGSDGIELHAADLGAMDTLELGPVGVALLAFNTLFNLTTEAAQLACLTRCVSWLANGGSVVVEAFVPADDLAATGRRIEPTRVAADEVVLTVSEVLPDGHSVHGQHIHVRESGIRLRPWQLRVLTPTDLDALCERAGLTLTARWGGWHHEPFGPDTDRHVSIYRPTR